MGGGDRFGGGDRGGMTGSGDGVPKPFLFLVAVLGFAGLGRDWRALVDYGSIPVALLTVLSGAAYLNAWLRHMAEAPSGDQKP